MPTRDDLLQELGLTPTWRLRHAAAAPVAEPARLALAEPDADAVAYVDADGYADAGAEARPGTPPATARPVVSPRPVPVVSAEAAAVVAARRAHIAALPWDALAADIAACTACGLCRTRKLTVPGVGDARASWLFVGEAPGAEEDARGEPFVGQAGRLLDNMLAALGLARGRDVYIANVLKCRPPNNRTPEPGEVDACRPYLDRQIELIGPRLVVALGKSAATTLLGVEATIASLRGRVHRYRGVPLVVTYHPAYLLRSLPDKAKAWEDLLLARRTIRAAVAATDADAATGATGAN
jgi:DNA polymerase